MTVRIAACGAALTAAVLSWIGPVPPSDRVAGFLVAWGLAFGAYLVALHAARHGLPPRALGAALAAALVWRLALVLAPPLLSDDVYRYVWEGRIQHHGGNPFRQADRPEAERWAGLRDAVWEGVNHKELAAIYPPLFQLLARAAVGVSDSVVALKLLAVLAEALALAALAVSLRARGLPLARLLVLAWSPLALVEIAGGGHNDAVGIACVAAALAALDRRRPLAAAAAVGAGIAAKLLPGLIALAWVRRARPRRVLAGALLAAGVVLLLALPYRDAGADLFRSLGRYGAAWRFNETLFPLFAAAFGRDGAVRAAAIAAALVALAAGMRRADPAAGGLLAVAAWLALAPDVLPWYALWLLPFLVLRLEAGALLFTGTAALAYLVYPGWQSGEPWQVGWGVRALEYLPCALVALAGRGRDLAAGR